MILHIISLIRIQIFAKPEERRAVGSQFRRSTVLFFQCFHEVESEIPTTFDSVGSDPGHGGDGGLGGECAMSDHAVEDLETGTNGGRLIRGR